MDKREREEILEDLGVIRRLARKIRERSGIPVVESCTRWCETYCQIARWSLGEGKRFEFMEAEEKTEMAEERESGSKRKR